MPASEVPMQLTCKSCGVELHPADVDMDALQAKCRHCGWVFGHPVSPHRLRASGEADPSLSRATPEPQELPLPNGLSVESSSAGHLQVRVDRKSIYTLLFLSGMTILLSFAAIKLAYPFVLPWYLVIGFIFMPLMTGYCAAVAGLNTVLISTDGSSLRIKHGPLPWFGSRLISRKHLRQLYVSETEVRTDSGVDRSYNVRAQVTEGDVVIISGLAEPQTALYLERKFEQMLRIIDVPVDGEYQPGR
jgi:hypothetical protein